MMVQKLQARIMTTLRDWDIETGLGLGSRDQQALLEAALGRCSLQQTQLLLAILPRAQLLKGNERTRYMYDLGLNLSLQLNLFP